MKRAKTTLPPWNPPQWKTVLKVEPEVGPIVVGDDGRARIRGERLPLEVFLGWHDQGYKVEDLQGAYPWLPLADIHAVLAWVLNHRSEVDEYLRECERIGAEARKLAESLAPPREQVEALKARWAEMQRSRSAT